MDVMINLIIIGILGFSVFLLPHLGFPNSWQSNMFTAFGLVIMALAYRESLRKEECSHDDIDESERAYVDSEPMSERPVSRLNRIGENGEGF